MDFFKSYLLKFCTQIRRFIHEIWAILFPALYVKYYYKKAANKKLNLRDPKGYYEKVQWLKVYSDTSLWTETTDKFKVRKYVEECGLSHILVKLYGVWEKAEDIDFASLPEKFVLKPNNCFGRVILVYDKGQIKIDETRNLLNKWVRERYGLVSFQPHYWNIERRIIAEELLEDSSINEFSKSLIDYKFFCIHGEPQIILVLFNRNNTTIGLTEAKTRNKKRACVYDMDWNMRPEIISGSFKHDIPVDLPKPMCFDEMKQICRILSNPFPQVRVDLYEVGGKVYFGELTFTDGGNMETFTSDYYLKLGEMIDLSKAQRRTKKFIV